MMARPLFASTYRRRALSVFAVLLVASQVAAPARAQSVQRPPRSPQASTKPSPSSDDVRFADAVKAAAEGTVAEALADAQAEATRRPKDREAAARVIALFVATGKPSEALTAYDQWTTAAGREDLGLLGRVAHEFLRQLDRAPLAQVRVQALEARARHGDEAARRTLAERRKAMPPTADSWEATLALARLGEADAVREVAGEVRAAAGGARLGALASLNGLPDTPDVVAAIRTALLEGDDAVRDAAASAAIGRRDEQLRSALRTVMDTARFAAPLKAAVALVRMGDAAGRARVEAALASELPDARLLAAQAYAGSADTRWITQLEPVLRDANPLMRVLAAELLLPARPAEARLALGTVIDEQNPVLRAEAMRVLATDPAAPLALLRAALRDEAPWVRLHAARALFDRAAAPAAPAPRR